MKLSFFNVRLGGDEPTSSFSKTIGTATPGIQLERAVLCFDCETVAERCQNGRCPHCGSASTRPLASIIEQPQLVPGVVDSARRR